MEYNDIEASQASTSQRKIRPTKRKTSLLGCLENLANQSSIDENNKTVEELNKIANELKRKRKIQNKQLQIELIKLKFKYPTHDFIFDSSESE